MARQMTATRNFTFVNVNSNYLCLIETRKSQPQQTKELDERSWKNCLAGKRPERSQPDPSAQHHLHGGHSLQEPDLSLVTCDSLPLCLAVEFPFCMSGNVVFKCHVPIAFPGYVTHFLYPWCHAVASPVPPPIKFSPWRYSQQRGPGQIQVPAIN